MRPAPRPVFLENPRRLSVRFYTSNIAKYLQAKLMFESFGLSLHHFKSKTEPYTEAYELGKDQLLVAAVDEIKADIGKTSLFFVEDTSLRIEALSSPQQDSPGLAVKEWFSSTTFDDLNKLLPPKPEERRAIVKSDIALHIPGLADPIFFRGETLGTIALTPPNFKEDPFHPWLTPHTFNGWLIPHGATRRLGEMSLDESLAHDFRAKSLMALLLRLEEYAAILNAPSDCYVIAPPLTLFDAQANLFNEPSTTLVVVGATCAGKTTFGSIARQEASHFKVVEASDVVRSFRRIKDQDINALNFARILLDEKGPDVAAKELIRLYRLEEDGDFIITGFRTIEELEAIRAVRNNVKVVFIEASGRNRFARYLRRGRGPTLDFKEFLLHDRAQWFFGLLRVASDFADIKIVNEGSLEDFRRQAMSVLANPDQASVSGVSVNTEPRHQLAVHRLFRCLSILAQSSRPMTCDEIEQITVRQASDKQIGRYTGKPITQNNVNKILKSAPELAMRVERPNDRVQYSITSSGLAYIRLMTEYSRVQR